MCRWQFLETHLKGASPAQCGWRCPCRTRCHDNCHSLLLVTLKHYQVKAGNPFYASHSFLSWQFYYSLQVQGTQYNLKKYFRKKEKQNLRKREDIVVTEIRIRCKTLLSYVRFSNCHHNVCNIKHLQFCDELRLFLLVSRAIKLLHNWTRH